MTIFDDYKDNKGRNTVSPTLLWEYDLTHFDWQRSRKIVVQRIIERGWLLNFEYDWKQIARRLKEMTVRQEHIFSQWPLKEQKLPAAEDKDITSMKRGRKR